MVTISGLVSVSGCRSQSPNCSSIVRPASERNEDNDSALRNRSVLRLNCGRSQLGLVKVMVKETMSPSTGVSTWCVLREGRPYRAERISEVIIIDEHLERMAAHYDQVELSIPIGRG